MTSPKVVALGGGHGLYASLSALRLVTEDVTAVVTVADNGGSSGRLREDFDVLPPGDLRMALSALCDDSEWGHTWRDVLQHRFSGDGELSGHALGNLLIVALWQLNPDPVTGLDLVGSLLNARGRVLPMASVPLSIQAEVAGLDPDDPDASTTVTGQVAVARARGRVESIELIPPDPPACGEAIDAVRGADWLVFGPGSWFTSVLPHLLVPELRDAIVETTARRMIVLNLELNTAETFGFTAEQHLSVLAEQAPGIRFDVVLADPSVVEDEDSLRAAAAALGAELVIQPVRRRGRIRVHDSLRLAAALADILT
ncbi:gluconeogenesis factor YvcK family protein [Kribbia dieselivorans]|uniref:gluconeogenesis factor YvcK family protein n=1 Tax=Kribbia dieselivorans TaxID=331526 RepID=UPI00083859FC|nr:uridine diphosphate-N-acetylglucosamine-binding protein YvcK [Kribbia dieselivorans]